MKKDQPGNSAHFKIAICGQRRGRQERKGDVECCDPEFNIR